MSHHPIRIYLADWHLTPERIFEVFKSGGDPISEEDAERFAEFLDYKDPVLAAGLPDWDMERGNPLFHAYQAFEEDYPSVRIPVVAPETKDGRDLADKGLSLRRSPFHGTIGIPTKEVVRFGTVAGEEYQRPAPFDSHFAIRPNELDGFKAFELFKKGEHQTVKIGVYPTLEAAQAKADSAPATPFSLFSNDSPGWLVFDNGGKTFDRYTLFVRGTEGVDAYTLSFNADSPQGVCQFADRHSKRTIPVSPEINEWVPVSPEEIPVEARRSVTRIIEEYGHPDPYGPIVPEAGSPELG
jgi:hypothetical protein